MLINAINFFIHQIISSFTLIRLLCKLHDFGTKPYHYSTVNAKSCDTGSLLFLDIEWAVAALLLSDVLEFQDFRETTFILFYIFLFLNNKKT